MEENKTNWFQELYDIDLSDKVKTKGQCKYVSWAYSWAEIKKRHPDATYVVHEQPVEWLPDGTVMKSIPWFTDGKTCWVKVTVKIGDFKQTEMLPIMDFKNAALPLEKVTSTDANKAIKRALSKCVALLGCGLHVYENEEFSEAVKKENTRKQTELSETNAEVYDICQEIFTYCKENKNDTLQKKLMDLITKTIGGNNPKACKDIKKSEKLKELVTKMKEEIEGEPTESAEEKEQTTETLKDVKAEVVKICTKLGGTKNEDLMKLLKEYTASGNPNAIKSIDKAKELLEKLKAMK